jgi:hypothetical protein
MEAEYFTETSANLYQYLGLNIQDNSTRHYQGCKNLRPQHIPSKMLKR